MSAIILCTLIGLHLNLWLNREDGIYYPSENLKVFFRVDEDCFVTVYNIERGGKIKKLFPPKGHDGWVSAGKRYQLPPADADYDYVISGPPGIETIIACASTERQPAFTDEGPDIVESTAYIEIKEPEPARLIIVSRPIYARIYISKDDFEDEEYAGCTPREIVIRPGSYWVTIRKPGFHPLQRKIWLEPGAIKKVMVRLILY